MTNYDVIKKLIGEIEPIGDSRVDEKRFENLKETTLLVEQLLRDVHAVVSFSDCSQASMNKAGRWAKECMDGFRKDLVSPVATTWSEVSELKTFDIDCAGNILLRVEIINNIPKVMCAMNGYGNAMEVSEFIITLVEPDEAKEAEPKVIPEGSFQCSRCGKATRESKRAWEPFKDMCQDCAPF